LIVETNRIGRREEISENEGIHDQECFMWEWRSVWWKDEEIDIKVISVEVFQRELHIEEGLGSEECLYHQIRRSVDQLGLGLQTEICKDWLGSE